MHSGAVWEAVYYRFYLFCAVSLSYGVLPPAMHTPIVFCFQYSTYLFMLSSGKRNFGDICIFSVELERPNHFVLTPAAFSRILFEQNENDFHFHLLWEKVVGIWFTKPSKVHP